MTTNEVMEKYGLKPGAAYTARKKGFFVKNYSRPQVKVNPSKFDPDICYRIAGKVFMHVAGSPRYGPSQMVFANFEPGYSFLQT